MDWLEHDRRDRSPEGFAAHTRDWMEQWYCLGPGCRRATPNHMYCSDACREASKAEVQAKRKCPQ